MAVFQDKRTDDRLRSLLRRAGLSKVVLFEDLLPDVLGQSLGSVLDIGCGKGDSLRYIFSRRPVGYRVGLDFEKEFLFEALRRGNLDDGINADVKNLPFRENCVDVCLLIGVLSYLEKQDGLRLLAISEALASRMVVVFTPIASLPRLTNERLPEYQRWRPFEHKSEWLVDDFASRGYKVVGVGGIRGLRDRNGKVRRIAGTRVPLAGLAYLSQLFTYSHPRIAFEAVCTKEIASPVLQTQHRTS